MRECGGVGIGILIDFRLLGVTKIVAELLVGRRSSEWDSCGLTPCCKRIDVLQTRVDTAGSVRDEKQI